MRMICTIAVILFHFMVSKPTIQVCLTPGLAPAIGNPGDASIVVTDVLRATTSMAVAFSQGAASVVPVKTLDEARQYKKRGYLIAAERGGKKVDFADLGNSPTELLSRNLQDEKLVFTTTNGTLAIHTAKNIGGNIFIGAFVNLKALAAVLIEKPSHLVIICSGWNGAFCMEDTLFAGALADRLLNSGNYILSDDAARASVSLWRHAAANPLSFVSDSSHCQRLLKLGAKEDIEYAFRCDILNVVPVLRDGKEIQNLLQAN